MNPTSHIILFDGACNFCSFWVNYVLKRDTKEVFRFAPLQAEKGQKLLEKHQINRNMDSIVLIGHHKSYVKSTAALRILKTLGGLPALFYVFIIIPPFIRDLVYDVVARYRYQWFGKSACAYVPQQNVQHRFLV